MTSVRKRVLLSRTSTCMYGRQVTRRTAPANISDQQVLKCELTGFDAENLLLLPVAELNGLSVLAAPSDLGPRVAFGAARERGVEILANHDVRTGLGSDDVRRH